VQSVPFHRLPLIDACRSVLDQTLGAFANRLGLHRSISVEEDPQRDGEVPLLGRIRLEDSGDCIICTPGDMHAPSSGNDSASDEEGHVEAELIEPIYQRCCVVTIPTEAEGVLRQALEGISRQRFHERTLQSSVHRSR